MVMEIIVVGTILVAALGLLVGLFEIGLYLYEGFSEVWDEYTWRIRSGEINVNLLEVWRDLRYGA